MIDKLKSFGPKVWWIFAVTFLVSTYYALSLYINSSFLEEFMSKENVGYLFAAGSILSVFFLTIIPTLLKKFGQYKLTLSIFILGLLSIVGMSIVQSPIIKNIAGLAVSNRVSTFLLQLDSILQSIEGVFLIIPLFLIFYTVTILMRFDLDLYLEHFSKNEETGSIRGIFLTFMNLAVAISPFLAGLILTNGDYWRVYLISSSVMLLAILILIFKLKSIPETEYLPPQIMATLKRVVRDKDLRGVFASTFLLEFFYSWMVIYTPIYLHNTIGFDWAVIGAIFSIMLTAFIIFEAPLGWLADTKIGEKEIMTIGFVIMGISTGAITFITTNNFIIWTSIFFLTRVGASFIEIMNETYFFKKISNKESGMLGLFRNTRPLAYIFGALLGGLLLSFIEPSYGFKYLFLILGFIVLSGTYFSLSIKDTL